MSRICKSFIAAQNLERPGLGWRPEWMARAEPTGGMGVAHDLLEHLPGDRGEVSEELRALGAAYWLRGETGYLDHDGSRKSPMRRFALDFALVLAYQRERRLPLARPRSTAPMREPRLDAALREIVRRGQREAMATYGDQLAPSSQPRWERALAEKAAAGLDWLRIGYRLAASRYRASSARDLAFGCFDPIAREADRLLADVRPGERLIVSVSPRHLKVALRLA